MCTEIHPQLGLYRNCNRKIPEGRRTSPNAGIGSSLAACRRALAHRYSEGRRFDQPEKSACIFNRLGKRTFLASPRPIRERASLEMTGSEPSFQQPLRLDKAPPDGISNKVGHAVHVELVHDVAAM